jgi:predicted HAD superfamily Cof-like phosphohydrolase
MGKGSKQRPLDEQNKSEFASNWDRIFNKTAVDDAADVMSGVEPDGQKPTDDDPIIENYDPEAYLNRYDATRLPEGVTTVELDDLFESTNFELAGDFMNAFGQEVLTEPTLPDPSLAKLRLELIREEVEELNVGIEGMDIVEIADALTDILYVVYGAGHAFGIDLDECYHEVHRSNMSKLGEDGKPIYREDGKILKGPDYFHPNLKDILDGAI